MAVKILKLLYETNIGTNIEIIIEDMPPNILQLFYETNIGTIIQDMPPEILKQQQRAILEVITILQK